MKPKLNTMAAEGGPKDIQSVFRQLRINKMAKRKGYAESEATDEAKKAQRRIDMQKKYGNKKRQAEAEKKYGKKAKETKRINYVVKDGGYARRDSVV